MPTVQGTNDFNHAITSGYYTDGFFGSPTAVGTPLYQSAPASLSIVTDGGNVAPLCHHDGNLMPVLGYSSSRSIGEA